MSMKDNMSRLNKDLFVRAYDFLFYLAGLRIYELIPGSNIKTRLNCNDLVCFLILVRTSHEGKREVFISPNKVATILGCSKDTVRRSWKKLELAQLIERKCFQVVFRPTRKIIEFDTFKSAVEFIKKNPSWTFSTTKYNVKSPKELKYTLNRVKRNRMGTSKMSGAAIESGLPSYLHPIGSLSIGTIANAPTGMVRNCKVKKKRLVLKKKLKREEALISEGRH